MKIFKIQLIITEKKLKIISIIANNSRYKKKIHGIKKTLNFKSLENNVTLY